MVVVSGLRDFTYMTLLGAKQALDAGAALVATSRDPTMPMPGGEWPGTGAVLAAVEVASGKKAEIAGKPEHHLFDLALSRIPDAKRVAMIGDRLSSDIAGGHAAGLDTILVLSGTSGSGGGSEDPATSAVKPTRRSRTSPPSSPSVARPAPGKGCGGGLAPWKGCGRGAGAREGTRPLELAPGERDAAVSATTPAGCGRGRDGRVRGERRIRDGGVGSRRDPSPRASRE